jgi:hypothetical protein
LFSFQSVNCMSRPLLRAMLPLARQMHPIHTHVHPCGQLRTYFDVPSGILKIAGGSLCRSLSPDKQLEASVVSLHTSHQSATGSSGDSCDVSTSHCARSSTFLMLDQQMPSMCSRSARCSRRSRVVCSLYSQQDISDIFMRHRAMESLILDAAKATTIEQPFLMMPPSDSWFALMTILNEV